MSTLTGTAGHFVEEMLPDPQEEDMEEDEDDDEDEDEDEDAVLLTEDVQQGIFDVLAKIKSKDRAIYDRSKKFFDEGDEDNATSRAPVQGDSGWFPPRITFHSAHQRSVCERCWGGVLALRRVGG